MIKKCKYATKYVFQERGVTEYGRKKPRIEIQENQALKKNDKHPDTYTNDKYPDTYTK